MYALKRLVKNLVPSPSQLNEKDTINRSHGVCAIGNRLQLPFPREAMPAKEKILYSLNMEGSLSIIDIKILTGLPRVEIHQILEELIKNGEVKNKTINLGNTQLIPEFYQLTKV